MNRDLELVSGGDGAAAVIEAARAVAAPADLDPSKLQAFALPADVRLEIPDIDRWRDKPARKYGTYLPADVDSFILYVSAHSDEHTTVWIDPTACRVTAILNDNAPGDPAWGDHQAILKLELTPEWSYWARQNEKMLAQEDFAEHIEGGLEEIIEPDGADMLELAQNFHATSGATFRSSVRLASGQQRLQYDEEVKASAGNAGDMTVPTMFLLGIAPFLGEEPYRLAARLRFRVVGGRLTLGYYLDRPDRVIRDAIERIAEKLVGEFEQTYVGAAPQR